MGNIVEIIRRVLLKDYLDTIKLVANEDGSMVIFVSQASAAVVDDIEKLRKEGCTLVKAMRAALDLGGNVRFLFYGIDAVEIRSVDSFRYELDNVVLHSPETAGENWRLNNVVH